MRCKRLVNIAFGAHILTHFWVLIKNEGMDNEKGKLGQWEDKIGIIWGGGQCVDKESE